MVNSRTRTHQLGVGFLSVLVGVVCGCNSVMNGWLDPTVLGNFSDSGALEIRTSLTLEDTPWGVPGATLPRPDDILVKPIEYPISPGDTLAVEIHELRERGIPFQSQVFVSNTGFVNLPVVGRIDTKGLTPAEVEERIARALQDQDILVDPQVTVNPIYLQFATYSIFGIGVSASTNAPLRAGTFPIRRPDLRVLEAINQVGGLNEFVTDVYVFRQDDPPWMVRHGDDEAKDSAPADAVTEDESSQSPVEQDAAPEQNVNDSDASPEDDLLNSVLQSDPADDPSPGETTPGGAPVDPIESNAGPMDPFVYVDGQFVRNPAIADPEGAAGFAPVGLEGSGPTIDWERIAGGSDYRVIRITADRLRIGDPESNVVIRGGDVIRIVSGEVGVYYVMGQVNRVGQYRFNAEQVTLKGAIAAAGGLTGLAWPDRCTVYRRIGQREQLIQVDLDRIFAAKEPDFFILRGDIINVGTHPFAPFLASLRGFTIPIPTTNVGYSFMYSRNFADIDSFSVQQNPNNTPPRLFP